MKKILLIIMACCLTSAAWAQAEVTGEKHSVSTNSFWANWFVQGNVAGTSFWGSQEQQSVKTGKLFKDYRTNLGFSLSLGKWFTPGLGLRTKFNGIWGRSIISEDKEINASRYWTLQEQVLFNLSNMLMGYNEQRMWNFIPYMGGGLGRNMSYNTYALGFSVGLLNTFRLSPKVAFNIDIHYGSYESSFDGFSAGGDSKLSLKGRDRAITAEVGFTYRLGNSSWKTSPDVNAIQALAQSEIDALNAQLADIMAENDRLNDELANVQESKVPEPVSVAQQAVKVTQLVSAPVSVFFNLDKAVIASQSDLQNVAALIAVAKEQGAKLVVTGYADSMTGSAEHNRQLSQQRAEAVADEIVKMGFAREQIETVVVGGVDTLSPITYNRRATIEIKK
jgi:outer membrane protein OmpA-like peptidoglycan-associated protein